MKSNIMVFTLIGLYFVDENKMFFRKRIKCQVSTIVDFGKRIIGTTMPKIQFSSVFGVVYLEFSIRMNILYYNTWA